MLEEGKSSFTSEGKKRSRGKGTHQPGGGGGGGVWGGCFGWGLGSRDVALFEARVRRVLGLRGFLPLRVNPNGRS